MEEFKKTKQSFILCLLVFITLFGCSPKTDIKPSSKEIYHISEAAGYLASEVERTQGLIASPRENGQKVADYAYLYDNALALIVMCESGANWHLEKIADSLVFAQSHDRSYHDGRFRNAYTSGDPKSDSGRSITGGRISIRLPGFWDKGNWQEDYYMVSTSTGNMAWAMIALCKASQKVEGEKKSEYLDAAMRAADFVLTLKSQTGGFVGGYEGWDQNQIKVNHKSTEHNIDLIYAYKLISQMTKVAFPEKSKEYEAASQHAEKFALSMYDKKLHCFYTGTESDGKTISKGVIPIDTNSLAILCMSERLKNTKEMMQFVEESMSVGGGFDFSTGDLDGIWNEGTSQMAICYFILGEEQKYQNIMKYLKTQVTNQGSLPAADRDNVSTGFIVSGLDLDWEFHNTISIGATSWYAMAQMKYNPFK